MLNTPFSPWPSFSSEEIEAVDRVLRSNRVNYWTGNEGREFEQEFAQWCGVRHAIALSNGTIALEIALRALQIGAGDEVIVTPRTFVASASSIVSVGAVPIFADVDPDSQNITSSSIERLIGPRTRAILCVHLAGWPCDMDAIGKIAKPLGLALIEDCAQAHGARYRDRSVGSMSDIAAWSFCQDKIMTTGGEGGMLTTNSDALWNVAWSYKDHGKSHAAVYKREHRPGFRWVHDAFGGNARMTEMQAAIGRVQLRRMSAWMAAREANATHILKASSTCSALRAPLPPPEVRHGWYRAYAFVRPEALSSNWSRDRIMSEINEMGVPCYAGSCSEVYLESAFQKSGLQPAERLRVAQQLGETSLMFLVHPTLSSAEVEKTADTVRKVMHSATRP